MELQEKRSVTIRNTSHLHPKSSDTPHDQEKNLSGSSRQGGFSIHLNESNLQRKLTLCILSKITEFILSSTSIGEVLVFVHVPRACLHKLMRHHFYRPLDFGTLSSVSGSQTPVRFVNNSVIRNGLPLLSFGDTRDVVALGLPLGGQ